MQHHATSRVASAELAAWIDTIQGGSWSNASILELLQKIAAHTGLPPDLAAPLTEAIGLLRGRDQANLTIAGRYRAFIEAIPDAVTVYDENGDVADANAAACRLHGRTRDTLLTLNIVDFSPMLTPDHIRHVIQASESGDVFAIETTLRRGDGRDFPVEVHSNVYFDGADRRIVSVARGIGHWQRVAKALGDAEQRYRVLLHVLDKGVVVRDGRGPIVYCNPAVFRVFRLSEAQLIQADRDGYPGWRLWDADGREVPIEDLPSLRAMRSGLPMESELMCFQLPHLRHPRWILVSAAPLFRADQDKPYQIVTMFSDVTELKHARDVLDHTQSIANIGGFELVLGTHQLTWTDEMYRLFDLPTDVPITLERAMSLLAPGSRERAELDLQDLTLGGSRRLEYEIDTALGRRRWINVATRSNWRDNKVYSVTGMCQDVTERKLLEIELRHKAVTDPMTGLANRENILEELGRQILATREGAGPALLYVDLDRFKVINDILGAPAGDQLLIAAASRLRDCLPAEARCGRFAGDEFLVVLPHSLRDEQLGEIAELINAKFRRPFEHSGEEFVITASVGIARYPKGGRSAQQLLQHADAAMTEAKRRGRSTWQTFSPAIERRLQMHMTIESQLRFALANGELRLAYQPQVDLATGRVVSLEALLRWDHPERGELHPLAFIQHAEISGDIVPIGAWVIDEACRQLREWRDIGLPLRRVAVNVSHRQLLSESFLESVSAALRRHDLPSASLELEMIERMLIEDTPDTLQVFKDLRATGVTITIDDFGEGYCALNYLRRLPVDGFKISYDFMRRVPVNAADVAICEAIVRAGDGLGLNVLAEGVETDEQRRFLMRLGLKYGQGHLFSPALRAEQVAAFVREREAGQPF